MSWEASLFRAQAASTVTTTADKTSFVAAIAAQYGRRLRRFLSVRLRNVQDVPELAQEVFLRLLRVERHEAIRNPEAYLFTVASHVIHQYALRRTASPAFVDITEAASELTIPEGEDPVTKADNAQRIEHLESFPPLLQQILGGLQSSFIDTFGATGLVDPFRGGESVVSERVSFASNPNLKPETGDATTLGLVYSNHGFEISLSYFNIHIASYIFAPDLQTLVDNPGAFPGAITRAPPTAQDQQQGFLGRITAVNDSYFNFGSLRVAGFDADLRYAVDTRLGQFTPSLALANVYRWDSALTPNAPAVSYLSQATVTGPGFAPRWKGTTALAWRRGPFAASLAGRYVGRYKDYQESVPNTHELGQFWIVDLNTRYDLGRGLFPVSRSLTGTYLAVGAVNLFDRLPQLTYNLPFDPAESDIRGRFVYGQIGIQF
jgi:hypothetical protein